MGIPAEANDPLNFRRDEDRKSALRIETRKHVTWEKGYVSCFGSIAPLAQDPLGWNKRFHSL
jgi:hypothetical protein